EGVKRKRLSIREGGDAGEGLALQEFQGGPSAGGTVGHFVLGAPLSGGRCGVPAADHGDDPFFRDGNQGIHYLPGASGEWLELEYSQGPVPDDGPRSGDDRAKFLDGLRPAIEPLPARRNAAPHGNDLGFGGGVELVRGQEID